MNRMNDALRAEIARGWQRSGLTQREYAALHGISERCLRGYLSRFASRRPPVEHFRSIIFHAIEQLQAALDRLDVPAGMPDGDEVDAVESSSVGRRPTAPMSSPGCASTA